jgi:hypothetical protein
MRHYIKKIQAKDEIIRRQIFAGLMIFSMVFVGFIWIYSLKSRFNVVAKEKVREDVKPFKLFANSLTETYQNISASVGKVPNLKAKVESEVEKKIIPEKQIDLIVFE